MPPAAETPAAATTEEKEEKNAAVRSYLSATIAPALLKALVEMEKEERERPIVWLAQYLADYSEN